MQIEPAVMSRREAERYLGLRPHVLDVWASEKRYSLAYIKIGRRVGYRKSDLDEFLESRTVRP